MLYALVDCSGKRSLRKIYAEEMLGEVKVVVPKFTEKNGVKYAKLLIKKIDSYKVQNVLLSKNIENNADFHRESILLPEKEWEKLFCLKL